MRYLQQYFFRHIWSAGTLWNKAPTKTQSELMALSIGIVWLCNALWDILAALVLSLFHLSA